VGSKRIKIDDFEPAFGENVLLEIKVARLASGTEIKLPIYIFRGNTDGPVVLLSGGLHGDESNGIEIVRRMIRQKYLDHPLCGTIIAMPIINIFGFLNFSRAVPDGKDVNRSFPGNKNGSLASMVAYIMTNKILPLVDIGIDYHTGGAYRTNWPQTRFDPEDDQAKHLSDVFAAPFSMQSKLIKNSLRWQASSMNIPLLVFEGGESMRNDEFAIQTGIEGTMRVLKNLGMVENSESPGESFQIAESHWIRAKKSGMFRAIKKSGQKVEKGDLLGMVNDPFNVYESPVKSQYSGYIIGHNNIPVVHKGDALFHIGIPA
jgi:predicted deacylase